MSEVGRFAPSPSGRMHLGNLLCSLLAWLSAKQSGGRIVLRIEDLDRARCPRKYADQLEADLQWLGLHWDEGGSQGGAHGPYYQSQRDEMYWHYFKKLQEKGLVYPCFCTRAQLHAASAPHREDGTPIYSGICKTLSTEQVQQNRLQRSPAMRCKVPDQTICFVDGHMGEYRENLEKDCGDFVLQRSDGVFAYQLAVVVDDACMGVTQVVRGADLLDSTPRQIYLYQQLGLKAPQFYHLPLLLAQDGRRLSKRDGDVSLEQLQSKYTAPEIIGRLAYLVGILAKPEPAKPKELLTVFDWSMVPKQDIRLPNDLF